MLNFNWWINNKSVGGRHLFSGGFLGLDNIGAFDRGGRLPTGGFLTQSDGTGWVAFFALCLMRIALELALRNPVYQSLASKFLLHFLEIAQAIAGVSDPDTGLWDSEDSFYYDTLTTTDGKRTRLKVRSLVGLIPLCAVEVLEPDILEQLPEFSGSLQALRQRRPDLARMLSLPDASDPQRVLLSLAPGDRLRKVLRRVLDPDEFFSDYGIRSMSKYHLNHPFVVDGHVATYEPGESSVKIMGGNSNWRGPVWFAPNFLLIEAMQKFHSFHGDSFEVECPTHSGRAGSLRHVADQLMDRQIALFELRGGMRPAMALHSKMSQEHFRDHLLFHEYFHGDSGRGVGASHQTGWTGLVAALIGMRGS